jgi:hypothetical protein
MVVYGLHSNHSRMFCSRTAVCKSDCLSARNVTVLQGQFHERNGDENALMGRASEFIKNGTH